MRKTLYTVTILAIALLLFVGCARPSEKNDSSATGNYSYSFKNAQEIHTFVMKESGKVEFDVDSKVLSGDVNFTFINEDGSVAHEDSGKKFSFNKEFNLDIGEYEIVFNFQDAVDGILELDIFSESRFEYDNGEGEGKKDKGGK